MEIGAVKQAFNNELILLKKKSNQAKIQIIHKLTRKAKTFTEKKAPEPIKEKLKRKAESAVKEVLIIKKIKPKDLAKFAVTHKGNLNDHLNKPNVDQDKACARLLLHKSLQDKYKLLKSQFTSIPIKDLLMSREERKKLKKEAREKQKNKNKGKDKAQKVVNAEGEWNVEDIETSQKDKDISDIKNISESESNEEVSDVNDYSDNSDDDEDDMESEVDQKASSDEEMELDGSQEDKDVKIAAVNSENGSDNSSTDVNDSEDKVTKLIHSSQLEADTSNKDQGKEIDVKSVLKPVKKHLEKKTNKKNKQNKNKNLNEKLLARNFKKVADEVVTLETNKIVDPFFITSTGENYMSIAEPRQPDEVKEIHKQGNRKLRRAAMFGHVPKIKPRQEFRADNDRFNKQNVFNRNYTSNKINGSDTFNSDKRNFTDKRNKFNTKEQDDSKPEKLHPSWEAKKRQSGILPFQGKKIVFDES